MVRQINLVNKDGSLDRAASLRLFSRMVWPDEKNAAKRNAYIRSQLESLGPIKQVGKRTISEQDDCLERVQRGANAGDLVIYFLQLYKSQSTEGARASLRRAVPYTRGAHLYAANMDPTGLPRADVLIGTEWQDTKNRLGGKRIGRTWLLNDFQEFRPVAHFWAAVIIAQLSSVDGFDFLRSPDQLPRFIALAETILERAMATPFDKPTPQTSKTRRRTREMLIPKGKAVRAVVPDEPYGSIRRSMQFELPPISPTATRLVTPPDL